MTIHLVATEGPGLHFHTAGWDAQTFVDLMVLAAPDS